MRGNRNPPGNNGGRGGSEGGFFRRGGGVILKGYVFLGETTTTLYDDSIEVFLAINTTYKTKLYRKYLILKKSQRARFLYISNT